MEQQIVISHAACVQEHAICALLSTPCDAALVVTADESGAVVAWARRGASSLVPRLLMLRHAHPVRYLALAASEPTHVLLSLCARGLLAMWDLADGRCLRTSTTPLLPDAGAAVGAVLPSAKHAIIGGEQAHLVVVHIEQMRVVATIQTGDWAIALSALAVDDGSSTAAAARVVCLTLGGHLQTWLIKEGAADGIVRVAAVSPLVLRAPPDLDGLAPRAVQISDDQSMLLVLSATGFASVHELRAPRQTARGLDSVRSRSGGLDGLVALGGGPSYGSYGDDSEHAADGDDEEPTPLLECVGGLVGARLLVQPHGWELLVWGLDGVPRRLNVPRIASSREAEAHSDDASDAGAGDESELDDSMARPFTLTSGKAPPVVATALAAPLSASSSADGAAASPMVVLGSRDGELFFFRGGEASSSGAKPAGALSPVGSATFTSGWAPSTAADVEGQSSSVVRSSAVVTHRGVPELAVLGDESGRLKAVSLPSGEAVAATTAGASPHAAAITVVAPLYATAHGRRPSMVASADVNGVVVVWTLPQLLEIGSCRAHTGGAFALREPPSVAGDAARGADLVSVAWDGAIALYRIRPDGTSEAGTPTIGRAGALVCTNYLAGHADPVRELLWAPVEQLLLCRCSAAPSSASMLYMWSLDAGRLERLLGPDDAAVHLAAHDSRLRQPLSSAPGEALWDAEESLVIGVDQEETALVESTQLPLERSAAKAFVSAVFDVRRLARAAKVEARKREELFQSERQRRPDSPRDSAWIGATGRRKSGGGDTNATGPAFDDRVAAAAHLEDPAGLPDGDALIPDEIAACRSALAYVTAWGLDAEFDEECRRDLGTHPPASATAYGLRSAGGAQSFLTPWGAPEYGRWSSSAQLTASYSLFAVALANTLMTCPGNDDVRNVCSQLVAHFSVTMPERISSFCPPSLSLLATHYIDEVEEVQQAARALMEGVLQRMSTKQRRQLAYACAAKEGEEEDASAAIEKDAFVATPSSELSRTLVLSLLTCRFGVPLDKDESATLVKTLERLLDEGGVQGRSVAAELLSKGYRTWRPHLTSARGLIRRLFSRSMEHASAEAEPNRFHSALMLLGLEEPRAFCSAMGEHAVLLEPCMERTRRAAISAIVSLVRMRGASLEAELPLFVDTVMKPLDPSVPQLREGSLSVSTAALRELVRRYPMMHFNHPTQRLAVGTVDGIVLLYDLRTATKWRILQGHQRAISALSFSAAGDWVASYSAGDRTLRWWLAGSNGLFGFLGLQGLCQEVVQVATDLTTDESATSLEWTSPTCVALSHRKEIVGFFAKPV